MMDHGFFDGSWRTGSDRGGKPFIFTQEWRDHLAKRKAQAIEARSDATTKIGAAEGESAVAEGHAPQGHDLSGKEIGG